MMLDLMDRTKIEDVDGMLAVIDEYEKLGIAVAPFPALYWRRRTELEGMKTFERITEGDLSSRAKAVGALSAVAEVCTMRHRKEIIEWVTANPAHFDFRTVFHTVGNVIAQTDPDVATDLVFELAKDRAEDELNQYLGGITASIMIVSGGYEAVGAWFDRQSDERKAFLFPRIVNRMAAADLAAGGKWWKNQIGKPWWGGKPEKTVYRQFLVNQARKSPEDTLAFIATTPDGEFGAPDGLTSTISVWTQKDPIAAGKWLQGKFDEKWFARAAAGYHKGLRWKNPENAEKFLEALPLKIRTKVIEAVQVLDDKG